MNEILPIALIDGLKCILCKNYLSYFPITLSNEYENICGRCNPHVDANPPNQNTAYETIANFSTFPCRYKAESCPEEFYPKDIPQHEKNCPFRIVSCPVGPCDWTGSYPKVIEHCEDQHSDMFLEENAEFEVIPSKLHQQNNLIIHDGKLLLIKWKFEEDAQILQCGIHHCPDELEQKNFSCQLSLRGYKVNLSVEFQTGSFDDVQFTKFLVEVFGLTDNLKLIGLLVLGRSVQEQAESIKATTNLQMLSILKCSKCSEFVLPPISEANGSVLCKPCMTTAYGLLEDYFNVGLSSMANLLQYPCKHHANGCKFVAKPDEMKNHHLVCDYTETSCVFVLPNNPDNCPWVGQQRELISHIEARHEFIASGKEFSLPYQKNYGDSFNKIIKFSGNFFRMVFQIQPGYFYWTVQNIQWYVGEKFKFEVEIIDVNKTGHRLLARKTCSSFPSNFIEFSATDGNEFNCHFDDEQLFKFLPLDMVADDKIYCKVTIFKDM